ncbi:hypothetical protein [Kitasatospora sp. NPDC092286]|uniref:hypothetical protein n=1 Tax=Kitasatospora sp. NPDC092286 TaxID=3364087 RepID=UPI0038258D5C
MEARIRVHALFALVNDGVRNRPCGARPDLGDCLRRVVRAVLGLPEGGGRRRWPSEAADGVRP